MFKARVLSNLLHQGNHHYKGAVLLLSPEDLEILKGKGLVEAVSETEEVKAAQPEQPAETPAEAPTQPEGEIKATENENSDTQTETPEEPATPEQPATETPAEQPAKDIQQPAQDGQVAEQPASDQAQAA